MKSKSSIKLLIDKKSSTTLSGGELPFANSLRTKLNLPLRRDKSPVPLLPPRGEEVIILDTVRTDTTLNSSRNRSIQSFEPMTRSYSRNFLERKSFEQKKAQQQPNKLTKSARSSNNISNPYFSSLTTSRFDFSRSDLTMVNERSWIVLENHYSTSIWLLERKSQSVSVLWVLGHF